MPADEPLTPVALESPTPPDEIWEEASFTGEEHELLGFDLDEEGEIVDVGGIEEHASGVWDATFNFTNSIIGAGIIGLPYAFAESGFATGVLLLFALTFVVDWTVNLLIVDGKLAGTRSYQELVKRCFGRWGFIAVSVFQFVFAYGAMCAYAIIVGDTLPVVLSQLPSKTPLYSVLTSRRAMITLTTLFVSLPLSLYRDISALAKTSAVSLGAIVFIVLAVVGAGAWEGRQGGDVSWVGGGVFQAIGVISFAFVCHHNTFLIYGSLRKPTMDRFAVVTHLSTGLSLLACLVLACGGYLVFTDKTQGNILNNFSPTHPLITLARLCFGINMFLTFPLECFVCREVLLHCIYGQGEEEKPVSLPIHAGTTVALTLSAMGVALWTCDLGIVLEITGGFAATVLAYILPPLCYIYLSSGPTFSLKKAGPLLCIGFGVVVMVLSTSMAVAEALRGKEEKLCAG
ncbi:uncharacterized protein SPPG_01537 [Spizellomyces punctatus DAOM BR117]|uniref:Amino acid transporter transmembrane domain-containing protein n=1 Tax=Spizellomyces punctatus (strain DAOM BR117) TaxID=645134 RepID=A0A0L0HT81_SPIPD|nr:uncharacterized protein SPPG_01537 [Spizellomyces punctatus DAOM BR117]KND04095.1 hypothetical protein SPPG_01537 [Spizellomyces punctatus DAOM BR117]|eukprot:XP_016612134.1 hypothetical protein SPPG_01537 [Spizellomyces punctatus DAOM BR117]